MCTCVRPIRITVSQDIVFIVIQSIAMLILDFLDVFCCIWASVLTFWNSFSFSDIFYFNFQVCKVLFFYQLHSTFSLCRYSSRWQHRLSYQVMLWFVFYQTRIYFYIVKINDCTKWCISYIMADYSRIHILYWNTLFLFFFLCYWLRLTFLLSALIVTV